MHLCAELTAAFWTLEPFGEIGANFSPQLSSLTRFDKINKKKVIAKNQCEKHKKSSLDADKILIKVLIRLCGCAGWSAHLIFVCNSQKPVFWVSEQVRIKVIGSVTETG